MAKLFRTFVHFIRSLKNSKAPRWAPVGLIKNWDAYEPSTGTLTSERSEVTSVVDSMRSDPDPLDFAYRDGGIRENKGDVEHAALITEPLKHAHKVSTRYIVMSPLVY